MNTDQQPSELLAQMKAASERPKPTGVHATDLFNERTYFCNLGQIAGELDIHQEPDLEDYAYLKNVERTVNKVLRGVASDRPEVTIFSYRKASMLLKKRLNQL